MKALKISSKLNLRKKHRKSLMGLPILRQFKVLQKKFSHNLKKTRKRHGATLRTKKTNLKNTKTLKMTQRTSLNSPMDSGTSGVRKKAVQKVMLAKIGVTLKNQQTRNPSQVTKALVTLALNNRWKP